MTLNELIANLEAERGDHPELGDKQVTIHLWAGTRTIRKGDVVAVYGTSESGAVLSGKMEDK